MSTAYHRGASIKKAAELHCGAAWIIKLDIQHFFESITEPTVYHLFSSLGYPKLLAFELTRLCTRKPSTASQRQKFTRLKNYPNGVHVTTSIGFLPQGAPTSPLLANFAMHPCDEQINALANSLGLIFSRYADDLIFSTSDKSFSRDKAQMLIQNVYQMLLRNGFEPNKVKTKVLPPGARKIVLGLLVDREHCRLTRDFRETLETHVYYLASLEHGPIKHAEKRGFDSVIGLQNHVHGLLAHARQIDPKFADTLSARLQAVKWPI